MNIQDITDYLETLAPTSYQESYDNAGLLVGNPSMPCTGILVSLDVTEEIIEEAQSRNCNLIVAHHPIIFKGLKKLNGKNFVERTVISAIRNEIAIYAIHTNLDNVLAGVNKKIADTIGLKNVQILLPKEELLMKLVTFCPLNQAEEVRSALFLAGAGFVGRYSECSFNLEGKGTFKGNEETNPFVGKKGVRHEESETRIEVIFPAYLKNKLLKTLNLVHPYEEVAYYLTPLENSHQEVGSGLIGDLEKPITEIELLQIIKSKFHVSVIRHTAFTGRLVSRVALCGGAGIFLLPVAKSAGADFYFTGDIKYHEFFDADGQILLADIGHFESEQFTIDLLTDYLKQKYPNFAVLKTERNTNPVQYFQ